MLGSIVIISCARNTRLSDVLTRVRRAESDGHVCTSALFTRYTSRAIMLRMQRGNDTSADKLTAFVFSFTLHRSVVVGGEWRV